MDKEIKYANLITYAEVLASSFG